MDDTRIRKWQSTLSDLDGCWIDNPVDLLYLTGLNCSKGRLWATSHKATLFVDGRYFANAQKIAPCQVKLDEKKAVQEVMQGAKRVGFDSAFLTYDAVTRLQASFPHQEWIARPNPLQQLRLIKDAREIAALRKAAKLTREGCEHVQSILKEGMTETEAALEFEVFCRKRGASGFSFDSIIAFGENSAYPHHRAGSTCLQKNQIVLIDVGAILDQYRGDMTRTVLFGSVDPKLARLDQLVKKAQEAAAQAVRPGIRLGELDQIAREIFRKEGVEELFCHNLGHGVGLDTHEYPRLRFDGEDKDLLLKPGMVFTIEPGLYQPGLGGSRFEDMIVVTETGYENLMRA